MNTGRLIWREDQSSPISTADRKRGVIDLSPSAPETSNFDAAIAGFKQRQIQDLRRRSAERKLHKATNKLNLANRQINVLKKIGAQEDIDRWQKEAASWKAMIATAKAELDSLTE